jgi:7-cyano-7-deazaguanine synthase in queuosine biosynthesis
MREHLFLCGLDETQRGRFSEGQILSLAEAGGNLKLKLDHMRRKLARNEPERLTDFLEVASYIFAADRTTSRGNAILKNMGEEWRRALHLVIGVREPAFWNRQDVRHTLSEALAFLSEDTWRLEFEQNRHPRSLQGYLNFKLLDADAAGGTSIVLFSGGLDSLAGAVHELRTTNRHVVLVSHRNLPIVGARQKELAAKLAKDFPKRVTHVFVDNSLTPQLDDREETQRTRSFFYTAIATVAAHIEKSDRIRFNENGVTSINLPIETQVVGARASRTTHPRSLQLLQSVVEHVAAHSIEIDNPFIWKTKTEVVAELVSSDQGALIGRSLSCSNSRTVSKIYQPHCGKCIQCVHRRLSTLGGGAADLDEVEGYETDVLTDPREDGPHRVMAFCTVRLALDSLKLTDESYRQFLVTA